MSETLLKFLLSELTTARVCCQNGVCGAIVEIPVDRLGQMFKGMACPICGKNLLPGTSPGGNAFAELASAIAAFHKNASHVKIEFVIPDKSK